MRLVSMMLLWIALMLTFALAAPVAADGPPIGGCPGKFTLVSVESLNLDDPSGIASLDRNGDGFTCIKEDPNGEGFVFRDNTVKHRQ
jgi:hypothetical protein